MKIFNKYRGILFCCISALMLILSGCYKEDTQILYSRQFVIPDLTAIRDSINKSIKEIQGGLQNIINKEPVTNIEYVTENGKTIGVNITFGNKTVFVPYGKDGIDGKNGIDGKDGADGKDGKAPIITMGEDGFWYIDGIKTNYPWKGEKGDNGRDGIDGKDGRTPEITIGDNGNWYINGEDTGKPSKGTDGKDGADGQDGTNGKDGKTPEITIGDNGNWYINGEDTGKPSKGTDGKDGADGKDGINGKDGKTPEITIGDNGNWYINGEDTGKPSKGTDGKDGADGKNGINGKDGKTPEITIGDNGNWYINGEDTGKPSKGADGQNGKDGTDGKDGKEGKTPAIGIRQDKDGNFYWTIAWDNETPEFIRDENGNPIRANGLDGKNGQDGAPGKNGKPGVDSPLRNVEETQDGYTFTLEFEGQPTKVITIPKFKKEEITHPEETPLTVKIADKSGDKSTSVITITTDPGAEVYYQLESGDPIKATADATTGIVTFEVAKSFDGKQLINVWARNVAGGKYSSPSKQTIVPIKVLAYPTVQLTQTEKYEYRTGIMSRENGSLHRFRPTDEQLADFDFQIRNWTNTMYGSPVTQTYNEDTKARGGFYVTETTYYSNSGTAELWVAKKGSDAYVKVGTYTQRDGRSPNKGTWKYDSNYPGKP